MSALEYSLDAKNILNKFYSVDRILYVEGDDDIPFWELIFEKFADFSVKAEGVGGKTELIKHAESIKSGKADYLIAMDSDYDRLQNFDTHPNILYSFGYSIENTIINEDTLIKTLRNVGRLSRQELPTNLVKSWLSEISEAVKTLVFYDIINREDGLGAVVMPSHSDRFMIDGNSHTLCSRKINAHIQSTQLEADSDRLDSCKRNIEQSKLHLLDLLRGHFLLSAVMRFIKTTIRRLRTAISVSTEMLFGSLLAAFETVFNDSHPHHQFYQNQVSTIIHKPKSTTPAL